MKSINEIYRELVLDIFINGYDINSRNLKAKELLNKTVILNPNDNIITLKGFETNLKYAEQELDWYLSGLNTFDFSPLIQKIWSKYSDDGKTVNSAYGWYFFTKRTPEGISQWEWIKEELRRDPDSRRCIFNINDMTHKNHTTKDMPCTIFCQVMIRNKSLVWFTFMRSNDVFYGFRNDIYCFTELQKRLASELNISVGQYYHTATSLHLYDAETQKAMALFNKDV